MRTPRLTNRNAAYYSAEGGIMHGKRTPQAGKNTAHQTTRSQHRRRTRRTHLRRLHDKKTHGAPFFR